MLYKILKIYVRGIIHLFCHSIYIDNKNLLKTHGPLLIASNHPNSFLDAIIFDILFDIPITSLARGDAFKNKKVFKLLRQLKMLPVYRIKEGVENLNINYDTFDACVDIFKQKESVLIFSEGLCINEWHLRPLKKGTARLAFKAWNENIPLRILPVGINYSSFHKYGKKINIHLGSFINADEFDHSLSDGINYSLFNQKLKTALQTLVYEIKPGDKEQLKLKFGETSVSTKIALAPFALAGAVLNAPVYWAARLVNKIFFSNTDHYDAVMLGFLLLTYPIYLVIAGIVASFFLNSGWLWVLLFAMPFSAFCYVKYEVRKG